MGEHRKIEISAPLVGEEEWRALRELFLTGWLAQGTKVAQFETEFAAKHHVRHAVAATSCTTALHLALVALGVGPGDEVIVPSFTWVATANVVLQCGAAPVLVDVEPESFNIDIGRVQSALTPRTKVVIAVHLFGLCADVERLRAILPESVRILEDAACATGATFKGKFAGNLGDIAAFSFHPRKLITTGEGGMVTTNDDALARTVSELRNHGASLPEDQADTRSKPYLMPEYEGIGFNYRMTDLQGAIGLVQLEKLDAIIAERSRWAAFYQDALADVHWLRLPRPVENAVHAWQAYVTTIDEDSAPDSRNDIMNKLYDAGISTRVGTHSVHTLAYYRRRFGFQDSAFPVASYCARNTMAIPLHNKMREQDYQYVVDSIRELA